MYMHNMKFFSPVRTIFLATIFLLPPHLFSQTDDGKTSESGCQTIDDADAQKSFEKSKDKKKYSWEERKGFLQDALTAQPDWADANLAMDKMIETKAIADGNEGTYPDAIPFLKKAVDNCPEIGAEPFYKLGTQYYLQEDYPNCIIYLDKYLK